MAEVNEKFVFIFWYLNISTSVFSMFRIWPFE